MSLRRSLSCCVALLALLVRSSGAAGIAADGVVALVNDAPILRVALDEVVAATVDLGGTKLSEAALSELRRDALQGLVDLELLYQESMRTAVVVSAEEIERELKFSRERFPSQAAFDDAMRARGVTVEQLRRDTAKTLAIDRLLHQGPWRNLTINDDVVRAYFDSNPAQFQRQEQVRASHILIRASRNGGSDALERARTRADQMLRELKSGRDFAELARSSSEDSASARAGGELGYFGRGEMLPELEEAAFATEKGMLSGVFQTRLGFHILRVTDRRSAGLIPFVEVKEAIRSTLLREERSKSRAQLVAALRRDARIEILDPTLRPSPR